MRELVIIAFSKDRAAQLHLLLESIKQIDTSGVLLSNLFVIHKQSSQEYKEGYQLVQKEFGDTVFFPKEQNLLEDITKIVGNRRASHIMFLVDDQVMISPLTFRMYDAFAMLAGQPCCTLSLRLGMNTTWQYQADRKTRMPSNFRVWRSNLYIWNRETIPTTDNFGYPLSVDSHIFRTDIIVPLLIQLQNVRIPNDLEAQLQKYLPFIPPLMACQEHSSFVSIPVNRVQDLFPNKTGKDLLPDYLNKRYLEGDRLDLEHILSQKVNGCHQELELRFKL